MKLSEAQSRACYHAAYEALTRRALNGFDVVIDMDADETKGRFGFWARPLASGCAVDGDCVVFANVAASDFGDVELDSEGNPTCSEADFVDGCIDSFGCIVMEDNT